MTTNGQDQEKSWTYAILEFDEYIKFIAQGQFSSLKDIIDCAESLIMAAKMRGHNRVLIDKRSVPPNLGVTGVMALDKRFAHSFVREMDINAAAITSPDNHETCLHLERVFQGLDINYRAFREEDEAIEWLMEQGDDLE